MTAQKSKRLEIWVTLEQAIKMNGFIANTWDNEINYIFSTYLKCLDLFSILFQQELEQDVSKVFAMAKFQRNSYIRIRVRKLDTVVSPTSRRFVNPWWSDKLFHVVGLQMFISNSARFSAT